MSACPADRSSILIRPQPDGRRKLKVTAGRPAAIPAVPLSPPPHAHVGRPPLAVFCCGQPSMAVVSVDRAFGLESSRRQPAIFCACADRPPVDGTFAAPKHKVAQEVPIT